MEPSKQSDKQLAHFIANTEQNPPVTVVDETVPSAIAPKEQQQAHSPRQKATHSHSESSAASSSSQVGAAAAQHEVAPVAELPQVPIRMVETFPKDTPKIPPPPSEHPPPYTPFGGQTATLLAGAQPTGAQARSNRRRVVQPPGLRKYLQYCTLRNLLIVLGILLALFLLIYLIHSSNRADEELASGAKPLEQHHRALEFQHKGLGAVKGNRDWISYDGASNLVILSEFDSDRRLLRSELVNPDDHLDGFRQTSSDLNRMEEAEGFWFDKCMRFSSQLFCCAITRNANESRYVAHTHQHLTKCFLEQQGQNYTSVATMFDFLPRWQALEDGEVLQMLRNTQRRHAILDLRRNIQHQIEEDRLPMGAVFKCFYFPRDTIDELTELVLLDDEFLKCEFVLKRQVDQEHGVYALKDGNCQAPMSWFRPEPELHRLLFCTNSLYTALVQYGHLPGESALLTWRLTVKFDSSPDIFSTYDSVHGLQERMAMNCEDQRVQLFLLGDHELHEFSLPMPKDRIVRTESQEEEKKKRK